MDTPNTTHVKDIPSEPKAMPGIDADRRENANLAPQGKVDLSDEVADAKFTPEGDQEDVPNIPPSGTIPS